MYNEIIDLTHSLENGIPAFHAPWHIKFNIEQMGLVNKVGRNTSKLTLGTHTATHVDAPLHFIDNGNSIDNISLQKFCGKVNIIDLSYLYKNDEVTVEILKKFKIDQKMVIFKFGWSQYWPNAELFYKDYPYFSLEAAQYLIDLNVHFIGMDTPSPDNSKTKLLSPEDSIIHKKFLSNNIIIAEYLNIPSLNDLDDWAVIAAPLKIKNGDGSPARIFLVR